MNPKKPTHPGTIVAMIVGILVAGYFIYNSLNPSQPAAPTVTAQAKKPADGSGILLVPTKVRKNKSTLGSGVKLKKSDPPG